MLFRRRNKEPQAPGGAVARQAPNQQPPSDTRAHASKNPGGVGAGPHIQTTLLAKRDQLH